MAGFGAMMAIYLYSFLFIIAGMYSCTRVGYITVTVGLPQVTISERSLEGTRMGMFWSISMFYMYPISTPYGLFLVRGVAFHVNNIKQEIIHVKYIRNNTHAQIDRQLKIPIVKMYQIIHAKNNHMFLYIYLFLKMLPKCC